MKIDNNKHISLTEEERFTIADFRRFLHMKIDEIYKSSPELSQKLNKIDDDLYWIQKGQCDKMRG